MEIFFVRHGETSGNVARRHQAENSPLTFKGEEQVQKAAQKIKEYEPTHLLTSPLVRAIDSAKVIAKECDLIPETSGNFAELKRPDDLYGKYRYNLLSFKYYVNWFLGKETKDLDGGESYDDFLVRISAAKKLFCQYPADARVVVVSHSVFINFFIAHLCDDRKMSLPKAFITFKRLHSMGNTQITHVLFDAENRTGTCSWILDM
jgi:broad specificity phosphatase PhoE